MNDDSWCKERDALIGEIKNYFQGLFVADRGVSRNSMQGFPDLSHVERALLDFPVIKEEVRTSLMSMKYFSAPGPNGFQPFFFKKLGLGWR